MTGTVILYWKSVIELQSKKILLLFYRFLYKKGIPFWNALSVYYLLQRICRSSHFRSTSFW